VLNYHGGQYSSLPEIGTRGTRKSYKLQNLARFSPIKVLSIQTKTEEPDLVH